MYNNYEENIKNTRRTTVMEEERPVNMQSGTQTKERPSTTFAPVTKSRSRLTVTNTGQMAAEVGKVQKPKEKAQTKNIAMMVVYSVVAIALAAVIAVNAITLGSISQTNTQLSSELSSLEATYSTLSAELSAISSVETMTELASTQLDLTSTSVATATFSVPGYIEAETQTFDNNWFDVMLDKLM